MATRHDPDGTDNPIETGSTSTTGGSATHNATGMDHDSTSGPDPDFATTVDRDSSSTRTDASAAHRDDAGSTAVHTDDTPTETRAAAAPATATQTSRETRTDDYSRTDGLEERRQSAYDLALARSRNRRSTDFGLLLLRVLPVIMFLHGLSKIQNFSGFRDGVARNSVGALAPDVIAALVVAGQLLLPIAIAVGLLTRLSALLMTILMVGIWAFIQLPQGLIDPANGGIRGESALLFAFLALPLVFTGPGRFSLDHAFFGRRADSRAQRKADKVV